MYFAFFALNRVQLVTFVKEMELREVTLTVNNPAELHIRPYALVVKTAKRFKSERLGSGMTVSKK